MTTPITKKIGSAGGGTRDASTWVGFVALLPADLVAADQQWTAEFYNDSNSFVVAGGSSCSGHTTDPTRFIKFTAAASNSFADNAGKLTNPLRYDQAKGVGLESSGGFAVDAFTFGDNYTFVNRLQFLDSYGSHNNNIVLSGTNCTIRECIVYRSGGSGGTSVVLSGASGLAVNVVTIADGAANDSGFGPNISSSTCINCTAIHTAGSTRFAFSNGYLQPLIRNCAGFGFADFGRTGVALGTGSDYNATNLGGTPNMGPGATHSLTGLTASTEWTATGASYDPRPKAGNSLAVGLRDQTYTSDLDIIGQARSTSTPTIGAFEFVSGGSTTAAISATGVATVIGAGASKAAAPITSTGVANVTGAGAALAAAAITSAGASTVIFVGTSTSGLSTAAATITGQSTVIFAGQATDAAAFSMAGTSTVIATGAAVAVAGGAFSIAGQAVVTFKGRNAAAAVDRSIIDGRPHIRRRQIEQGGKDMRDVLAIIDLLESGEWREAA